MKKNLIIIFSFLLLISCKEKDSGSFPQFIKSVEVISIEKYKGYLYLNDTIVFSGAYYKKGTLNTLYNDLRFGDAIINNGNSSDSLWVYSKERKDTIGYYIVKDPFWN